MNPGGSLDAANSKGVGGSARGGVGEYCLTGIGFAPKNAVMTPGYEGAGMGGGVAIGQRGACTAVPNTQISVTVLDANGALVDTDFFIAIN